MAQDNVRTTEGYRLAAFGSSTELSVSNSDAVVPGTTGQISVTADSQDVSLTMPPTAQLGNLVLPVNATVDNGFVVGFIDREGAPVTQAGINVSGFYIVVVARGAGAVTYRLLGPLV